MTCPSVTGLSGSTTLTEDQSFSIQVNTTGGVTTYALIGAPAGMGISAGGLITWAAASTPDSPTTSTVYNYTIRVGDGTSTTDYPTSVTVTPVNDAPVITSSAITTATESVAATVDLPLGTTQREVTGLTAGTLVRFRLAATGADGAGPAVAGPDPQSPTALERRTDQRLDLHRTDAVASAPPERGVAQCTPRGAGTSGLSCVAKRSTRLALASFRPLTSTIRP